MTPSTALMVKVEQLRKYLYDNAEFLAPTARYHSLEDQRARINDLREGSVRDMLRLYNEIRRRAEEEGREPSTPYNSGTERFDNYVDEMRKGIDKFK